MQNFIYIVASFVPAAFVLSFGTVAFFLRKEISGALNEMRLERGRKSAYRTPQSNDFSNVPSSAANAAPTANPSVEIDIAIFHRYVRIMTFDHVLRYQEDEANTAPPISRLMQMLRANEMQIQPNLISSKKPVRYHGLKVAV